MALKTFLFSATLVASSALAAPVAAPSVEADVVVIKVPAADLDRCIATLRAVFINPVEGATVDSVSLAGTPAPRVSCEAE